MIVQIFKAPRRGRRDVFVLNRYTVDIESEYIRKWFRDTNVCNPFEHFRDGDI